MKNFLIPISGLVAVGFTANSASFAQGTKNSVAVDKKQGQDSTVATFYGELQYNEKGKNNDVKGNTVNTTNTTKITQTTKIVKEESTGWWGKFTVVTLAVLAFVGYSALAVEGVAAAVETVGLTKFAEKLGIDKVVAQAIVIGAGVVGAMAAIAEYLLK